MNRPCLPTNLTPSDPPAPSTTAQLAATLADSACLSTTRSPAEQPNLVDAQSDPRAGPEPPTPVAPNSTNTAPSLPIEIQPTLTTQLGCLYQADCLTVLPSIPDESVDTVFADPPFNLGKHYGSLVSDSQSTPDYVRWCHQWLKECVRVLRPGGSIFVYNLPRWNVTIGHYLDTIGLTFRHWIAIENNNRLPIQGRLYPSHYSLIYYTKGRPRTFRRIRTPIETCRHCGREIKDYGGHRKAMHPDGVNLKDIWTDIPPVRHWKFKPTSRQTNSLSTKVLERVVEISTKRGDLVLDPFGGSGTTYAVCEQRGRRWIGVELEDVTAILDRLNGTVINHANRDIVEECPQ